MEELLKSLGIKDDFEEIEHGVYLRTLNEDNWLSVYLRLSLSENLEKSDASSYIDEDGCNLIYTSDEFVISLICDFNEDTYELIIKNI